MNTGKCLEYAADLLAQQPGTVAPLVVDRKPDDYFLLSLLACLFCNWICGLVALMYSMQVI